MELANKFPPSILHILALTILRNKVKLISKFEGVVNSDVLSQFIAFPRGRGYN